MLAFVRGDVTDGGEYVSAVCGGTLDAIPVIDATLASFMVDIKVAEVIVKIDATGTEVTTEEGGMGGEDGCDVNVAFATKGDTHTREPFVEVRDDGAAVRRGRLL